MRNVGVVHFFYMRRDVAKAHPKTIQPYDFVLKVLSQNCLALLHNLRIKTALSIFRCNDRDRTTAALDRLLAFTIALIAFLAL